MCSSRLSKAVVLCASLVLLSGMAAADPKSKDVVVVNEPVNPLPVTIQGGTASVVVEPGANPLPVVIAEPSEPFFVQDVGPPGRFQNEALMIVAQGTTGNSVPLFDVPDGKLAIVKFVSGRTFTDVDSWVSCEVVRMDNGAPLGQGGSHVVLVSKRVRPPRFAGQDVDFSHEFSQEMEFYVEGGLQAGFSCTMIPA